MTDITDRHTLRRMSWSELITAGQEAEFQRDYERTRIVWSFALHVATTTINKNLAIAPCCRGFNLPGYISETTRRHAIAVHPPYSRRKTVTEAIRHAG